MRYGANQLTYASLFTIHDSTMQITLATAQWSLTFNATPQQACPSWSVAPLQSGHVVRVRHHYATPSISSQKINPPSCCECRKRKPALQLDNTPRSITSKTTRKSKLTISKYFYELGVTEWAKGGQLTGLAKCHQHKHRQRPDISTDVKLCMLNFGPPFVHKKI